MLNTSSPKDWQLKLSWEFLSCFIILFHTCDKKLQLETISILSKVIFIVFFVYQIDD